MFIKTFAMIGIYEVMTKVIVPTMEVILTTIEKAIEVKREELAQTSTEKK